MANLKTLMVYGVETISRAKTNIVSDVILIITCILLVSIGYMLFSKNLEARSPCCMKFDTLL
jgi:TRAP-type C4-dicarboxylate transport system permease small subunit